jgi:alkylation response protein AidB-like acyl-CoA dehydrogenase
MINFSHERLGIAITSIRSARVCYEIAMKYSNKRKTFGKTLFQRNIFVFIYINNFYISI